MSKYKLIKKYPGSPELGTIAYRKKDYNERTIVYEKPGEEKPTYTSSTKKDYFEKMISSQPEFWEEVVEKEYEILSFYSVDRRYIYDLQSDGSYKTRVPHGHCFSPETFINCPIHSVKRLSDGEVFTVGDKIQTSMSLTIDSFVIIDNELLVNPLEIIGTISLSKIKKVKQPLFTTEDGVDIYEGDYVCWIGSVKYTDVKINDYRLADKAMITDGFVLYFSTKEAAEEYILMNKPCLSINDVLTVKEGAWFNRLKELVKSRL